MNALVSPVVLVPIMLITSSIMMGMAWIGHLKYKAEWSFWVALGISWMVVLPEYLLNVGATRFGHGTYTGGQMAAMNLSSGVVCVALVSHFWLGEALGLRQLAGFALMVVAVLLITAR